MLFLIRQSFVASLIFRPIAGSVEKDTADFQKAEIIAFRLISLEISDQPRRQRLTQYRLDIRQ